MLSPQSRSIEMPRRDRITAISSAGQRRPIVLVLGMHRSGTSLCSHLLSALGVDMADEIGVNLGNDKGHWERWEIVEFHDRILGLFNRDYLGRFHDFALPVAWWADPRVAQIRREIVAFLESRMGDGYFGFKDPRTVRLMPVWHQIFNELKLAPKLVLCLRNPAQVARSLYARESLDPANGEYRWLAYMIDFYRYTSNFECCAVEYEEWFGDPAANIEKLRKFLDLPWQQGEADLALLLSDLIDPTARHDDPEHHEANQPLVRSLYQLASRAGRDGEARDQIAYIVSQFVGFQQLQRPFQRAFEEVAKVAAKFPEVEQAAVVLRAAVSERDAAIASAESRASAAEGRLAAALAEIQQERTRADGLLVVLEAAQADAAVREAALAQAEQEGRERAAAVEVMQAEIAALWDSLGQLQGEAQQREDAAVAVRGEVAALRGVLARAEREAQQRATAAQALEAEARALRARLTQAESEARERAATTAALQAEIETLQGTLTAARQVGKAAIAAFRIETAVPTKPVVPRGWRRAITRFLGAETSF